MKSAKNALIVLLALATLAGSGLAWMQYQELIKLKAELLDPNERTDLQRRLEEARKRIRSMEDQLVALRGRPGEARVAEAGDRPDDQDRWAGRRNGFLAVMNDPKVQKLMAIQQKGLLDAHYAALFKSLNLSPQQLDQFKDLLVQKQQALMDAITAAREQGINPRTDPTAFNEAISDAQASVDSQIQAALGDAGFAQYQQYVQTLPDRNTVNQLQQALSYTGTPLSDDQASQMIQLLASTSQRSGNGAVGTGGGGPGAILGGGNQTARISDEAVTQASGVLSAPQIQALQQLQLQQKTQAQIQQAMRQAAAPPPPPTGG